MLKKFLTLVHTKEITNLLEISSYLDISFDMTKRIICELIDQGYLKEIHFDCIETGKNCSICLIKGGCQTNNRVWQLTEKGKIILSGETK